MAPSSHVGALKRVAREFDPVGSRWLSRADKLEACAVLFLREYPRHTPAISTLLRPCTGTAQCIAGTEELRRSGFDALGRSAGRHNVDALEAEHRRLYGDGAAVPVSPFPLVPVCACSYLSGDQDDSLDDVVAVYRRHGFDAARVPDRCPGHIATELEFQAHCLRMAAAGDERAELGSREFIISHLFPWGVVFAAATMSRSQHPVTRFAAEALEHILFCELNEARALE